MKTRNEYELFCIKMEKWKIVNDAYKLKHMFHNAVHAKPGFCFKDLACYLNHISIHPIDRCIDGFSTFFEIK